MNLSKLSENLFLEHYQQKIDVILFAHDLIGNVRGKSANGLMIHNAIFNVVAIVDKNAVGLLTSEVCQGVNTNHPIYPNVEIACNLHDAKALIMLCDPKPYWHTEVKNGIKNKLDLINASFSFIKNEITVEALINHYNVKYFDLRDVSDLKAYPNVNITNRAAKVIYVTGTDCGLGKRTATYEIYKAAKKRKLEVAMYATGQTGLMLGERGTVIDATTIEFSNGIVSQHITELSNQGYELILVEGQSDIFHPANSAVAISILHGANPDGIIIVHDENRKHHKGFDDNADLYKMHSLERYIETFKLLSLPCGPTYNTIGIATMGEQNIKNIRKIISSENIIIEDALANNGATFLLDQIVELCNINIIQHSISY